MEAKVKKEKDDDGENEEFHEAVEEVIEEDEDMFEDPQEEEDEEEREKKENIAIMLNMVEDLKGSMKKRTSSEVDPKFQLPPEKIKHVCVSGKPTSDRRRRGVGER